jgi:glycerophosphoryl diester phosphodiesterase
MTLVIAHRGASAYAPENTLRAFALAHSQGAEMIEFDVQQTSDGLPIVFHDDTTERWNGKKQLVRQLTWRELQQVSIRGEQIPTLLEVCQQARSLNLRMNLEMKHAGMASEVAQILKQEAVEDLTLISSFDPQALREMAEVCPQVERAYLMGSNTLRPSVRFRESWPFRALEQLQVQVWHPTYAIPFALRVIPRVRKAGYKVNVWTVNSPAMMQRLLKIGVDGIITDTPDVLRKLMG